MNGTERSLRNPNNSGREGASEVQRAADVLDEHLPPLTDRQLMILVGETLNSSTDPSMPSVFIGSLIAIGETRWINEIRAAAHKVIDADFRYTEFDPRHALGRLEAWINDCERIQAAF